MEQQTPEPRTFPNLTILNLVNLLDLEIFCIYFSHSLFDAPIILEGYTALSVEIK